MTPEQNIFAGLCTMMVVGLGLITWGFGGGKIAAAAVGIALVASATALLSGGPRK